jgi:excisionase family DNA binding protein
MGINSEGKLVLNLWPETGKLLNLSRATTYRLANEGVIPTIRMGKKFLVPKAQLERLLNGQQLKANG